jgi:ABC-type multidrug transport system fused ATPase/permease subunit
VIIPVLAVVALLLNAIGAVAVVGCAVLLFAALRPLTALGGRRARSLSAAEIGYASGVSEATRLAEETQVFDAGDAQIERIDDLMVDARELYYRTQAVTRLVPYLYQSFVYIIVVGGLVVLSAAGEGHVASLGAVVLLLVRAGTDGQALQGSLQFVRQGVPYVERLQAAAAEYETSRPVAGGRPLREIERLEFERVSYEYVAGRAVLSELSFAVASGETIGIIGPSGAGKSTIVQIPLLRSGGLRPVRRGPALAGWPCLPALRIDGEALVSDDAPHLEVQGVQAPVLGQGRHDLRGLGARLR